MTRRVYNLVVDESGKPIEGVEVHVSLNRTTYKDTIEVARFGVLAKTDRRGYWEISLHANDTLDDPNSFYTVDEIKNGKRIATHYIRVPSSSSYVEPIHIKLIETTPLPVTPSPNVVTGIAADNNQLLRGDVRLLAGTGIQLQQDNSAKTITIVNTGGGGGGGDGGGAHNLLSDTHSDTQPTLVQRGMLIVGRLVGTVVKWAGLALGAAGKFLKSTGTDVVWGDVDWTEVQNKPSTFPPSAHTHVKADITDFAHASAHTSGGNDPITGNIDANARVTVKRDGTVVGTRRAINFIAGSNISLNISDNAANEEVAVTISAASSGSSSHNLLDGVVHPDTAATTVQRGMLIVGRLIGTVVKWAGLALGAAGKFLKSNGTDVVWGDVDWTEVQNKPSTFPPSAHTHNAADVAAGQFGANTGGGNYSFPNSVGIGTTAPTARLHIAGSTGYNQLRLQTPYTPTSSDDPNGNVGDIAWDDNFIYVKTSQGWRRAQLSSFQGGTGSEGSGGAI